MRARGERCKGDANQSALADDGNRLFRSNFTQSIRCLGGRVAVRQG